QYWGRPHDYMWLSTTQPGRIYSEMKQAYDSNARRLWIVNVHDMKTAAYDLELFLDMAWDINSVTPSTLIKHQENWLCRELGETAGKKILPAMLEYYRLCGIRKPEFMGWTQVELSKTKYARGMSPVIDSEFSLTEFGSELDRYLEDYQRIQTIVADAELSIAPERKDAFFSEVKYPLLSAGAMAVKMLEAQRARAIASGTYDAARWTRESALMEACAKSMSAYFDIRRLTDYYNNELAEGKWRYSMCYNPRDLYVFSTPNLPVGPTEKEIEAYLPGKKYNTLPLAEVNRDSCIVSNACDYSTADDGVQPIQMLGHSMNAVSVPKNASITFEFDCMWDGDAEMLTAVIPTQPNDEGDIRFSVQIDDEPGQVCSFKEKFRSESWKQNVMRGQAIRTTKQHLTKGKHRLTITALDDHVIVDQWIIDFKPGRKFYVFPVVPAYSTQNKQ
ncbi:MAG: glycosyl hydrolase 115 family protein, partial [Mangrovibacterium sp.]